MVTSSPFKVENNPIWKKNLSSSSTAYASPKLKTSSSSSPDVIPSVLRQYMGLRGFTKAELRQHLPIRVAENTTKEKLIFAYLHDRYQSSKGMEASFIYWTLGSLRKYVTSELDVTTAMITKVLGEVKKSDWIHLAMLIDMQGATGRPSEMEKLKEFLETNFRKCR